MDRKTSGQQRHYYAIKDGRRSHPRPVLDMQELQRINNAKCQNDLTQVAMSNSQDARDRSVKVVARMASIH
jgi:hypothetical protein